MTKRICLFLTVATVLTAVLCGCRVQGGSISVTADQAKAIALADAGLTADEVTWVHTEPDREDGKVIYDVSFRHGNTSYEYDIDAVSGAVLHKDVDADAVPTSAVTTTASSTTVPASASVTTTSPTAAALTAEQARDIALADAGLTIERVTQLYISSEYDNGNACFDVSFRQGNVEYDYEIDAATGTILEKDRDLD